MRKYFVFLGCYLIITSLMIDVALGQTRTYQTGILKRIKDGVQALDFHPDGTKILIGGGDHSLKLWNLSTDKIDFEIPLTREVYSVLWLPNGKYFLANAGMVLQAYSDQGIYHNQLMGHNTAIWSMDTDPTGEIGGYQTVCRQRYSMDSE